MDETITELGEYLQDQWPELVRSVDVAFGELNVVTAREHVIALLTHLRDDSNCQFKQLIDVCGVDYPERAERFDVVYHLLSLTQNLRVRVKLSTDEKTAVPTSIGVFRTANWFERETWDMYGIMFDGHPDLRRLLTDYGFSGHPLRKDFPQTGYVEVRWDDEKKRIVQEPVSLTQDYRDFQFMSPWEGAQQVMDANTDEKEADNG